jgi:hypothetical protein
MSKQDQNQTEEEYVVFSSDVVGFWSEADTLHFVPTGFKEFPNKKYKDKMTTIIVGKLLTPGEGLITNKADEDVGAERGDLIGVWGQAGMREIKNLYLCKVKLTRDETLDKDVGKGQPMKGYRIETPRGVKPAALPNLTPAGAAPSNGPTAGGNTASDNFDDIPF